MSTTEQLSEIAQLKAQIERLTAMNERLFRRNERLHELIWDRREQAWKRGEELHQRALTDARNDARTLAALVAKGVTIGEPVLAEEAAGCTSCVWHAVNVTEDDQDGGRLSALKDWITEGRLGKPENVVLHPVMTPTTTA